MNRITGKPNMFNSKKLLFLAMLLIALPVGALCQVSTFSDPTVEYTFVLPESGWKMIAKPSATNPNVEYVFNDRREGRLEVRKLPVEKDSFMSDIMRDEESKLQFLQSYVAGKEENFNGNFRGNIFNYEFVSSGRTMSGRFYFLRANDTTVYVLRFTGERDRLRLIRNQTDAIARSFSLVKS
jgi:hypothetical protein